MHIFFGEQVNIFVKLYRILRANFWHYYYAMFPEKDCLDIHGECSSEYIAKSLEKPGAVLEISRREYGLPEYAFYIPKPHYFMPMSFYGQEESEQVDTEPEPQEFIDAQKKYMGYKRNNPISKWMLEYIEIVKPEKEKRKYEANNENSHGIGKS